jgi:NAD(P)-dependent dehydrogenase (short-subunit alcohol dehydrogenase family)
MAGEFSGKIVVVAGGSRGIGRGIGHGFAGEGAQTVLAAATEANLRKAADEIGASVGNAGKKPDVVAGDLRTLDGCQKVFDFVRNKYGRCDILINSAGATRAGNFLELSDELFQDGFALKYFSAVRLCRLFWPMLKESKGHVVNIIGGGARTPDPTFLIGGSVNAATANFSKGLAGLGKKDGVNVNVIHPGTTETDRIVQLFEQRAAAAGTTPAEIRAQTIAREGLQRLGTPEDSAALSLFLCSERARHIQGVAIAVDGGATSGLY